MAITIGNTSNSGNPGSVTSYSWNHTCAANTTCLVVAVAGADGDLADLPITGITYNGSPLTKANEDDGNGGNLKVAAVWYLMNPSTGSSLSIQVTHTGKVIDTAAAAIDLLGTDTTDALDGTTLTSTGATTTVNPASTGSIAIVPCSFTATDPATTSVTTGTQIAEVDVGPVMLFGYAFESGGVATVVVSGTGSFTTGATFKTPAAATGNPTDFQNLIITS